MINIDSIELRVIIASSIAIIANSVGLFWSVQDWVRMRLAQVRGEVPFVECIRAMRRVAFMVQATLAQLVLLGGMTWCARLPPGDLQSGVKNYTFLILAVQLGLKPVVDMMFVFIINRYPFDGVERRGEIRALIVKRRSD